MRAHACVVIISVSYMVHDSGTRTPLNKEYNTKQRSKPDEPMVSCCVVTYTAANSPPHADLLHLPTNPWDCSQSYYLGMCWGATRIGLYTVSFPTLLFPFIDCVVTRHSPPPLTASTTDTTIAAMQPHNAPPRRTRRSSGSKTCPTVHNTRCLG